MDELVKEIGLKMDETLAIANDPDAWWEKEKERKEALNKGYEYAEQDPRFEQYESH